MSYKVLLTTSGTGSRLGKLTRNVNKSLIKIGGKEIISYIIELYPEDIEVVVTLGYLGDGVKSFLKQKYPKRRIEFVKVKNFADVGSSLGYSMLQASGLLQCPFIFHCNDTIVTKRPPAPGYNWIGGSKGLDQKLFNTQFLSSFTVQHGLVKKMNKKGAGEWDLFHIGLVGFKDYSYLWSSLEELYKDNPNDSSLNDCAGIGMMLHKGIKFKPVVFKEWYDTGNPQTLKFAREKI